MEVRRAVGEVRGRESDRGQRLRKSMGQKKEQERRQSEE
jgi:hypothetical protein